MTSLPRAFAWIAVVLGALAPLAGSPYLARVDVAELAGLVAREEDHVTAVELAEWIRDRKPRLRVIDVRGQTEFDEFHIPTAERIPLEAVPATPFDVDETLVLYSDGGAHAAQAWVFLRALGYRHVYFLRGGLADWIDEVMTPTIPSNASAEARSAFDRAAEVSRYFGGTPYVGEPTTPSDRVRPAPPAPASSTAAAVARIKRRRC